MFQYLPRSLPFSQRCPRPVLMSRNNPCIVRSYLGVSKEIEDHEHGYRPISRWFARDSGFQPLSSIRLSPCKPARDLHKRPSTRLIFRPSFGEYSRTSPVRPFGLAFVLAPHLPIKLEYPRDSDSSEILCGPLLIRPSVILRVKLPSACLWSSAHPTRLPSTKAKKAVAFCVSTNRVRLLTSTSRKKSVSYHA
jgi:hypothetical protein